MRAAAVAAVKFGPGAARGLAAGTRPDSWGLGARMPDFASAANAQSLVCVQLEHAEAIAQRRRDPGRGGHRRVLHRPVGPVAVDGLSGQSQGAAGRQGHRRRRSPRSSPPAARPACPPRPRRWPTSWARAAAISTPTCRALLGAGAGAFLAAALRFASQRAAHQACKLRPTGAHPIPRVAGRR